MTPGPAPATDPGEGEAAGSHDAAPGRPIVAVEDLVFRYPTGGFELRIPRFNVDRGATVALTGPSGCGKTTLVNLVSGILRPLTGRIHVDGVDLGKLGEAGRRDFRINSIGYLFQDFGLLDYLDAEENILLPYFVNRSLRLDESVRERARRFARSLGIDGRLHQPPARLSGGECQRVALARALVTEPAIIIADEPTGNLDPESAARTVDLVIETAREHGATLLTITHDPAVAARHGIAVDLPSLGSSS